jgi:hypothetical protein
MGLFLALLCLGVDLLRSWAASIHEKLTSLHSEELQKLVFATPYPRSIDCSRVARTSTGSRLSVGTWARLTILTMRRSG